MVLHLAERLEVPLRERNVLLHAAGYAPMFPQRTLDDPALAAARRAVDLVLRRACAVSGAGGGSPLDAGRVERGGGAAAGRRRADAAAARRVNVLRL